MIFLPCIRRLYNIVIVARKFVFACMVNACASVFLWCGIGVTTRVTDSAFSTSAPRAYGQPLSEVIIDEHREPFGKYFMSLNFILIFKTLSYTSQFFQAYFKNVKCKT